jgi:hypothetical protein
MRKIRMVGSKGLALFGTAVALSTMSCSKKDQKHGSYSNEEPFSSMKMPTHEVDASVVYEPGDAVNGRNAIFVRVVDASEQEFFFAILNDGRDADYETVLKNLPLSWDAQYGVVEISDPTRAGPIPQTLFSKGKFERFLEPKSAIRELKVLLANHIDSNSGRPRIALEQLK